MNDYFDPKGHSITSAQFVEFYNDCYYLNNSDTVETVIETLLKADTLSPDDVMLILRWKLGRIDHKESQRQGKPIKRNADNAFITYDGHGRETDVKELCCYVSKNLGYLRSLNSKQQVLNKLVDDCNTQNIGTVYLITPLYFITKMEYPIYDRFAAIAIEAITEGKKPGEELHYKELPQKNEKSFRSLIDNESSQYQRYINQLYAQFEEGYKQTRDIDRALWVYGHLFQIKD